MAEVLYANATTVQWRGYEIQVYQNAGKCLAQTTVETVLDTTKFTGPYEVWPEQLLNALRRLSYPVVTVRMSFQYGFEYIAHLELT